MMLCRFNLSYQALLDVSINKNVNLANFIFYWKTRLTGIHCLLNI